MDWDTHADGWDDDPRVRAYAAKAHEALTRLLGQLDVALSGLRVLDFGCGTGLLTEALAQSCAAVVGLDPSTKMLAVLRAKIDTHAWAHVHTIAGTLEQALARAPQQLQTPFDVVVCSSVCAFVPDYPATVQRLASMLKPRGVFVQFDWERDDTAEEPFGLSRTRIETALRTAELTDVDVGTAFSCMLDEDTMRPLFGIGRRAER